MVHKPMTAGKAEEIWKSWGDLSWKSLGREGRTGSPVLGLHWRLGGDFKTAFFHPCDRLLQGAQSALLYFWRDEKKKKENQRKWGQIAEKTAASQDELVPEVMGVPFGKVFRNCLSVQDDSGQGHQLWLQAAGGARSHFRALPTSVLLQLYNNRHQQSHTRSPHLYILCTY